MPSLDQYWDEGTGYLPEGEHVVYVKSVKSTISPEKQTPGIEYVFEDEHRNIHQETFWCTEKSYWRMAVLMRAIGVTKEQSKAFNTNNLLHHQRMLGKFLKIELVKKPDEKYVKIKSFSPASVLREDWLKAKSRAERLPKQPDTVRDDLEKTHEDDDIPF